MTRRAQLCKSTTAENNSNAQTSPGREQHNWPRGERGHRDGEVSFLTLPPQHTELLFLPWKSCQEERKEAEDGRRPHTFQSLFLLLCQQTIASLLICESPQAHFMPLPSCFPSPSYLLHYLRPSEQPSYFSACSARR